MNKKGMLLWLPLLALIIAPRWAGAVTVTYPDFDDLSAFTLNGATGSINSGGPIFFGGQNVLRLTNGLSQSGSAFLTNPIALNAGASFSSAFIFQISNPQGISDVDGQGADGIVFVVQTVANTAGGGGGGIGYQGIANSLGIEFDTWDNGFPDDFDGNHMGIDLNGSVDSVLQSHVNTRMNNGAVWYAWVDYNGATDQLEARISETSGRPVSPFLSYVVDLPSVLGSSDAFIGFSSGTGSAGGDHDIRSWQFENTFDPIGGDPQPTVIPEPSTLLFVGLGSLGAGFLSRKRIRS